MHKDVTPSTQTGMAAEDAAVKLLQESGITIVERNYRCKLGEIDIIGFEGNTLVFIEVRQRSNRNFGSGLDSVNYHKQTKLIRSARLFLQQRKFFDLHPCRFDIVSASSLAEMSWIKDAFQAH